MFQRGEGRLPAPVKCILGDLAILDSDWVKAVFKEPFQMEEWLWRSKCVFFGEGLGGGRGRVPSVVLGKQ